jgi:uncharacterized protein YggE
MGRHRRNHLAGAGRIEIDRTQFRKLAFLARNLMKPIVSTILLLLTITTCLRAAEAPPREISTSGVAIVYVPPDEVRLWFGVRTQQASLDGARNANDDSAKKLVAALRGVGIDSKDLQADSMNVDLVYKEVNDVTVVGYKVSRGYSVRLRDPKKLETVIETALKNGANQMASLDYRSTQIRKHRDEARRRALRAAHEKATDLANELNCKVGSPRDISEYHESGYSFGNNVAEGPPADEVRESAMPLGQIEIRARVYAKFDLVPATPK